MEEMARTVVPFMNATDPVGAVVPLVADTMTEKVTIPPWVTVVGANVGAALITVPVPLTVNVVPEAAEVLPV
jgi:hypothetical protein